ncbi:MAG TPA: hypothetical protein VGF31_08825 [Myxococcaceae bacterium]|jgi:DNA-binding MarR family transcriptional regulator
MERFLAGHGITITEFQLMVVLKENPARTVPLAGRLRLDARPVGRALARLEERGVVRRAFRSRFSEWILEPEGAMHLELLEFGWLDVNQSLYRLLGPDFSEILVRGVDGLRYAVPERHPGWSTD